MQKRWEHLTDDNFYAPAARRLTDWYERCKRDLPWRKTGDPYSVLVSEAMLQQTQVSRVVAFYRRWMEKLPDFAALASADESDVLALWQGLGYYSRARNLLKTARFLKSSGMKTLPADPGFLKKLPGLGPYTIGALCSIAFNMPVPAVDGNVRRVFSRLLDLDIDPAKSAGTGIIGRCAADVLRRGEPRVLTQAFMELGATVCLPQAAFRCGDCPVSPLCAALKAGTQAQRPLSPRKNVLLRREGAALLIETPRGWLVRQRPASGLWAGFYEIPWIIADEGESAQSALARLIDRTAPLGPCRDLGAEETMKFTRWQVRVRLWQTSAPCGNDAIFKSDEELKALPMPAGLKRLVVKALEKKRLELFVP